jgi:probable rRNA maturation factor
MLIHTSHEKCPFSVDAKTVDLLVHAFVSKENLSYDEVSIHFIDNETMCAMHAEFFDDPSPTDCISFPMDDPDSDTLGYKVMGDVFVCPETAANYVKEHGGKVYEELTLYAIHGLLHLIGYDDITESDRTEMRAAEAFHLEHIRAENLWLKPKDTSA